MALAITFITMLPLYRLISKRILYNRREKLHVLLQQEKICICPSGKLFTDNTFTVGFNEMEELYHYEFMGWDGLWLLKIADYAFF